LPNAVRVFFGKCAMVRFRFAARAAFLIFRRAARFCLAEDILQCGRPRLDRVSPYQFNGVFVARGFGQLFSRIAIVQPRFVVVRRDGPGVTARDVMPRDVVRVLGAAPKPVIVFAKDVCERALWQNHVSPGA
jgi:hypothetical protein